MLVIERVLELLKEGLHFERGTELKEGLGRYRLAEELLNLLIQENSKSISVVGPLKTNRKTVTMRAASLEKRLSDVPSFSKKRKRTNTTSGSTIDDNGSFDDVIGNMEAKQALYESAIMKTALPAELFQGCRTPIAKILMFGPPGWGLLLCCGSLSLFLLLSPHSERQGLAKPL
jgi:predicted ATPase with chaperone activity